MTHFEELKGIIGDHTKAFLRDDPKVMAELRAWLSEIEYGAEDKVLIPFTACDLDVQIGNMPKRIQTGYDGVELETNENNTFEAFTSHGKTSLTCDMAQNISMGHIPGLEIGDVTFINSRDRIPVAFMTWETNALSIALKIIQRQMNCHRGEANTRAMIIERLQKDTAYFKKSREILEDVMEYFYIFDAGWSLEKLPLIYFKLVKQFPKLQVVFFDYIQYIPHESKYGTRSEKLEAAMRTLQTIAKTYGRANVLAAQQNRPDNASIKREHFQTLGKVSNAQEIEMNSGMIYAIQDVQAFETQFHGAGECKADRHDVEVVKLKDRNGGGIGRKTKLDFYPSINIYYNAPNREVPNGIE